MREESNSYSYYSEKTRQASGHSSDGISPGLDLEVDFICWLRCVFALPLRLSSQPVFIKEELGKRNQGWKSSGYGAEANPSRSALQVSYLLSPPHIKEPHFQAEVEVV